MSIPGPFIQMLCKSPAGPSQLRRGVQNMENAIHWINLYLLVSIGCFENSYPLLTWWIPLMKAYIYHTLTIQWIAQLVL